MFGLFFKQLKYLNKLIINKKVTVSRGKLEMMKFNQLAIPYRRYYLLEISISIN